VITYLEANQIRKLFWEERVQKQGKTRMLWFRNCKGSVCAEIHAMLSHSGPVWLSRIGMFYL